MVIDAQTSIETPEYQAFVDKFKPKKTTDDCYTPPGVFDVVKKYVRGRYGIEDHCMIRPFWPGADYRRMDYPPGAVVVDNPPFSIITPICRDYLSAGIPFFLFAPYLTLFSICRGDKRLCRILAPVNVEYENGAQVNTCFITNMELGTVIRSDPDLCREIKAADAENRRAKRPELPKYEYPLNIMTATRAGRLAVRGVPFEVKADSCEFIAEMDAQKLTKKSIFGSGFLTSDSTAAAYVEARERAGLARDDSEQDGVTVWELSEREKAVIERLNHGAPPY